MKTLRTLIVGMGLLALMATAAAGDARAETPKTKPEAAKSTSAKSTPAKSTAAKSSTKDKVADAKADANGEGKTAEPVRAPAVFPANPALKDWLAKAGTDSFFLVLDESAKKLQLVLGGVVIRNFDVAEMKVATPRRLGGAAPLPRDWHERVWTGAKLDPPHPGARTEIVGPEVGTGTGEVMVPPTPEEAIPVPSLYRIRFAEGLALEVTGGVAEQKGELPPNELATGFREKIRMLREGAPDLLRVRIQLTPEAYSEMYRSLPPGTDFVVMHADD
ncbi:MAG: hypothetical protein IPI48_02520 [bacterium]|nr:hypothetical protein [bacterium]